MKKLFLLIAYSFSLSSQAQQPFPTKADDPAWSVLQCIYGMGVWCNTETFHYVDTASVCGHSYSRLLLGGTSMYVRNEGQRTLFRLGTDCIHKEYLMYDYSLAVGDTTYCGLNMMYGNDPDTALFIVDSIHTVVVQGIERRRFSLRYDRCNQGDPPLFTTMDWIEGIGSITHPFFPIACICDNCKSGYSLLCADSASIALYRNVWDVCDTMITGIDEPQNGDSTFRAFQDLSDNTLVVQFDRDPSVKFGRNLHFALFSMDGRRELLRTTAIGSNGKWRMPLPRLSAGIYIVQVIGDQGMSTSQRVFIQ
jgi:hypothetical protein